MKRIKSFYTNNQNKYTKWGLICNWAITLLPFIFIGVCLWVGDRIGHKALTSSNLKTLLDGGDIASLLIFLIVFGLLCYVVLYKFIRMFWKPKHIRVMKKNGEVKKLSRAERRRADNEAKSNKDKYWGNE